MRAGAADLEITGDPTSDVASPLSPLMAIDPVVGHRPFRGVEQKLKTTALHDPAPLDRKRGWTRRANNLSLVRRDDVTRLASGPRVLLVGDSHLMGVVRNEDNCSDLLEQRLRAAQPAAIAGDLRRLQRIGRLLQPPPVRPAAAHPRRHAAADRGRGRRLSAATTSSSSKTSAGPTSTTSSASSRPTRRRRPRRRRRARRRCSSRRATSSGRG
jgi:hypothetical protein